MSAGLRDLTNAVLGKPYFRAGGGELKVERALVDRGWLPNPVTRMVRASNFAAVLTPSVGIGRTTNLPDTKDVRGMLHNVSHLITVEPGEELS